MVKRFDVYLVRLDPTMGSEIKKTRPALVVSPNEMNHWIKTVIVAPMTTKRRSFPSRVMCDFQEKERQIALDQIRTVDKARLIRKLGRIDVNVQISVLDKLAEIFEK